MKKLFLVSNFRNTAGIFKLLYRDYRGKKAVFIPTAAMAEKTGIFANYNKCLLKKAGLIPVTLDISKAEGDEIKEKICESDCIFVNGGNTFFLLQEFKRTGADRLIKAEIDKGKLYIGESAGAIITSPDIKYIKAMDSPAKAPLLKDCTGLCLTDFYTLPHDEAKGFKKAVCKIKQEYSDKIHLQIINNYQAIAIEDESIKIINS